MAAFPGATLDPNISTHQFNDSLGNGQSQARTFKLPGCAAVGLHEAFKYRRVLVLRNPDSLVPYAKKHVVPVPLEPDTHLLAGRRELDCHLLNLALQQLVDTLLIV